MRVRRTWRSWAGLALCLLAAARIGLAADSSANAEKAEASVVLQVDVFRAGEEGYHTFRIPSLIKTPKGNLLAFCEGRKESSSDTGDIDLVLKRSGDDGKTWSPLEVLWNDRENTCGNPCPVIDHETGVVWLLLTHNLGRDSETEIVNGTSFGTRTVWVSQSADDGQTWSEPVEITPGVKRDHWTWYATGPGIGIQLKSGRLVVPCDNKVAVTKTRQSHIIYSDDHGKTWQLGGVVGPNCNESQVVELSDGSLLLNMRSYQGNHRRLIATSADEGLTWTAPKQDPQLVEPVCQASLIRYEDPKLSKPVLIFSNPASTRREKMTIKTSRDEGKTWENGLLLHEGPSAYSCLTVLREGSVGCLYERGEKSPYEKITFALLSLNPAKGEE